MSNWISVEDRLPKNNECVLVFANDIISNWMLTLEAYICPEYDSFDWIQLDGEDFPCIVTHWMPLPEPPEQ